MLEKKEVYNENKLADGDSSGDLKGASEHFQELRRLTIGLSVRLNFPSHIMVFFFLDRGVSRRTFLHLLFTGMRERRESAAPP